MADKTGYHHKLSSYLQPKKPCFGEFMSTKLILGLFNDVVVISFPFSLVTLGWRVSWNA